MRTKNVVQACSDGHATEPDRWRSCRLMRGMSSATATTTAGTRHTDLLLEEAAAALRCSTSTLRRLIAAGQIKAFRVGKGVRIPQEEITRIRSTPA